jgi:hypothetical protein
MGSRSRGPDKDGFFLFLFYFYFFEFENEKEEGKKGANFWRHPPTNTNHQTDDSVLCCLLFFPVLIIFTFLYGCGVDSL